MAELEEDKIFYIVLRDPYGAETGWRNVVSKAYANEGTAREEAERLCRSTGKTFFVLRTIGVATPAKPPVEYTRLHLISGSEDNE